VDVASNGSNNGQASGRRRQRAQGAVGDFSRPHWELQPARHGTSPSDWRTRLPRQKVAPEEKSPGDFLSGESSMGRKEFGRPEQYD
jgi:hypothetical protein